MLRRRLLPAVLLVGALLLLSIGIASAALKVTYVLNSWDSVKARYENGNLTMYLDGTLQPFYTRLDFDSTSHPGACGPGTHTPYAGDAAVSLYHEDTNGAPGFQSTQDWSLVDCATFDSGAKYPAAADVLATCSTTGRTAPGVACVLKGTKDQVTDCTTGNCTNEIVTQFHVNLDTNCDGNIETTYGQKIGICLYWAAVKPPVTNPAWTGNFQARYWAGNDPNGGDKTINFSVAGPNAVRVSRLKAVADAHRGPLAAWAGALLLAGAAVVVWRRNG